MIRDDYYNVCNKESEKIIDSFEEKIKNHIKDNILSDYLTYYIAVCYDMNCLWRENIDALIESGLDSLSQLKFNDCDLEKIKLKLMKKYNLSIINLDPIDIKKIKN